MPTLSKDEAVDRLAKIIPDLGVDDLIEAYYELFPDISGSKRRPRLEQSKMLARLRDYFEQGLADEEIISLWNVVFPEAWNPRFDEDTGEVMYDNEPEPIEFSD